MSFVARWGSACGTPFDAKSYLEKHQQFDWMDCLKIGLHNHGLYLKPVKKINNQFRQDQTINRVIEF